MNPGDATSTSNGTYVNRCAQLGNVDASGGSAKWMSNTVSTFTLMEIDGTV